MIGKRCILRFLKREKLLTGMKSKENLANPAAGLKTKKGKTLFFLKLLQPGTSSKAEIKATIGEKQSDKTPAEKPSTSTVTEEQ
ncbi:hypothetical protein V6N13_091670 [Hibiscus sabdariffa]